VGESVNILVAGGSGFIGQHLSAVLGQVGHRVTVLSRNPGSHPLPAGVQVERWDGCSSGPWAQRLSTTDAVINLAGESLAARRWSPQQKERIFGSRILATRTLVEAMASFSERSRLLINASAVGYYGSVPTGEVREDHPAGSGFLARTCVCWEQEALEAERWGIRVVLLRTGVVLGEEGGALEKMLLTFRIFMGGPIGSGRQWFPWVHRDDVTGAILFTLANTAISGPVNLVAPESRTMESFARTLGRTLRRPSWLRVPAWFLRLVLGEQAEIVLEGQNIVPARLLEHGYEFRHPGLEGALREILGQDTSRV
jgi:uncharacterized protein